MKYYMALFAVTLLFVQIAMAGDRDGKIHVWSSKQPAVIWLEGVKTFTVPTDRLGVAGQTVEIPNQDFVAHNVYSISPAKQFNLRYYAMDEHKEVILIDL